VEQRENLREFQQKISRRLLGWSGFSIAAGLALLAAGPFWRGVGIQAMGWGAIDTLIALVGRWLAGRQAAGRPADVRGETRQLGRLLVSNVVLDVLYVLAGLVLVRQRGQRSPAWRGHGWGIIFQGAFLFVFDLYHALRLPKTENINRDAR
jgi:hypothetical protein